MANTKERTELQKVCMQYGRDCFAIASTAGLIRLLKSQGKLDLAIQVSHIRSSAIYGAKLQYFHDRKKLQPDWKDWDEQREEKFKDLF